MAKKLNLDAHHRMMAVLERLAPHPEKIEKWLTDGERLVEKRRRAAKAPEVAS